MRVINLNVNGAEIPKLGFGTYKLDGGDCTKMVEAALDIGYRHIDTAQIYKNEEYVGQGIENTTIARDEIFLTTKVWINRFRNGDLQKSVEASLRKLKTSYVDLVLLHWPNPEVPLEVTIKALNDVKERELCRFIGVSNFTRDLLEQTIALSPNKITSNQVEFHPLLDQSIMREFCDKRDIAVTAYSPLAQGRLANHEKLEQIGKRHQKSAAQVAIRWLYQLDGVIPIPKTSSPERARDNFSILEFELSQNEMSEIAKLQSKDGRVVNPEELAPDWD